MVNLINDIYPGSSTHAKVVFSEVLQPIKLEFRNVGLQVMITFFFWGHKPHFRYIRAIHLSSFFAGTHKSNKLTCSQPSGFIPQLAEHFIGIAEVMTWSSNPVGAS